MTCPACGEDLRETPLVEGNALAGMRIEGKYALTELIGEGAMGWVYRGEHLALDSSIAVKVMKPAPTEDDTRDQRFEREARAASRLNHPHVISIIDFGRTPGGLLYIVSELLRGFTLAELIDRAGALPIARVMGIADQVLSAIDEAHSARLVHRDLKPENVFITPLRSGEDFVKVLDFGIAKLADVEGARLTMAGQLFGTPSYMAPEQIRGGDATARSDLYACGMILYELLVGREAFPFESVMEVLAAQLGHTPPPFAEVAPDREIPEALEAVVMRCLEKDPAARYESAHELSKALHRATEFGRLTEAGGAHRPCPDCARPVGHESRFCPHCGIPLAMPGPPPGARSGMGWSDQGAEAPGPRGARRANTSEYATDEERSGPGWIGALTEPEPSRRQKTATLPPGPSAEFEWADASCDVLDFGELGRTPASARRIARNSAGLGQAPTLHASGHLETLDGVRKKRRVRSTSDQHMLARSTLNRRLLEERTLRFDLISRERELAFLAPVVEKGGVVEILGPVGSGRTRLLEAVGEFAHGEGLTVLRAGSDPGLHRTPWYPIQQLVAAALKLETGPQDLDQLREAALLQGLVTDDLLGLAVLMGLPHHEGPVELAVRRRETRSAALRALTCSETARHGVCLLVDDADELDAASQAFLGALVGHPALARRAVVLVGQCSVLPPEVDRLRVEPSPLGSREVELILRQAIDLSTATGPQILQQIASRSGGNVLHVTQAARLLAEGGTEVDSALPDLVQTRISRLPGDALRLLQMVCILGDEAPRQLVSTLFGDEELLGRALRLLYRRGLVDVVRGSVLRVTHPRLAEIAREMMPVDARRRLNMRALVALSEQGGDPLILARHALEAHAGEKALEVLHAAGRRAEQRLDDPGAAAYYRQALQLARWELLYDAEDEQCLRLGLRLGDALCFSGDLSSAELVLKEAIAGASHFPELNARLHRSLGRVQMRRGDPLQGLSSLEGAVSMALRVGDRDLLAEIYTNMGKALEDLGRTADAAAEMLEGVDLVTAGEGAVAEQVPHGFWRLLLQLGECQRLLGRGQAAIQSAAGALEHARREGSLIGEARSHFVLSLILDEMDRTETGDRHHAAAVSTFQRMGDRQSMAECLLRRAARSPDRHHDLLREALALSQQVAWSEGIQEATSLLASG